MTALYKLEQNFRSGSAICAAAERLIGHAPGRSPKRILPRQDAPLGSVTCHSHRDPQEEIKAIAMWIRELEVERNCGVLLRTNRLADEYRAGLESYGIPVATRSKQDAPPDWGVVRSLLAALVDSANDMLALRFVAALKGNEQAAACRSAAAQAMASVNETSLHLPDVATAAEAARYVQRTRPSEASEQRLLDALETLDADADVAALVVAAAEPPPSEPERTGVCVCTYHSAKGLEWQATVLPAFEEGILPSVRDAADPDALAEARRIAFVGVTRAEQWLRVSWCRNRAETWGARTETERQQSRFVAEMNLVDLTQ